MRTNWTKYMTESARFEDMLKNETITFRWILQEHIAFDSGLDPVVVGSREHKLCN
jgi:hypothetical protein